MQIRVSPDALRSAANQQESIISSIKEESSKLNSIMEQLAEAWQGASGDNARNILGEIIAGIKNAVDSTSESFRMLISVAEAFEKIDQGDTFAFRLGHKHGLLPMPNMPSFTLSFPGQPVRIDTDRVREIAEQCKAILNSISENGDAFANSAKALADDWEGISYMKYEEKSIEIVEAFKSIEENLSEFISRIISIANRYEEIDNSFNF